MVTFKEQMAMDLENVFYNTAEFAEQVIYDDGASQKNIKAVVDYGGDGENSNADHATITVKKSDVPAPVYRQKFIIAGETWHIVSGRHKGLELMGDEHTRVIRISRNERFSQWQK